MKSLISTFILSITLLTSSLGASYNDFDSKVIELSNELDIDITITKDLPYGITGKYNSLNDKIFLKPRSVFISKEFYQYVTLHEIAHWTGHVSRLGRYPLEDPFIEEVIAWKSAIKLRKILGLKDFRTSAVLKHLKHYRNKRVLTPKEEDITREISDKIVQYLMAEFHAPTPEKVAKLLKGILKNHIRLLYYRATSPFSQLYDGYTLTSPARSPLSTSDKKRTSPRK